MNIKKLFFVCACIGLLFLSCDKFSEDQYVEDVSLSEVLVKSKLVVGIDISHPPLSFIDTNGQLTGCDIDIMTAVADAMDIDVEFCPIKWDEKNLLLESKRIDCIASGFSLTEKRKNMYDMTEPYFKNAQIILVLKEKGYKRIEDLRGKTIGGQAKTVGLDVIKFDKKFDGMFKEVKEYHGTMAGISDVKNRGVDAAIADISIITKILKDNPGVFQIIEEAIASDYYVYAFKKGNHTLKNEVEKTLIELEEFGVLEEISRKWFGADVIIIGK